MKSTDRACQAFVIIFAVFVAFLDQRYKKVQYQEVDAPKGTSPLATVHGEAAPNHGDVVYLGWDYNAKLWSLVWMSSAVVSYRRGFQYMVALPMLVLMFDNFTWLLGGPCVFDTEIAIQRGYELPDILLDETSGHGFDYGFNLWNGTLNKTVAQAQVDKWDHMISELGLQPGDRLLDVGCGYGDWLAYAKSKGIRVTGINISPEQAEYAKANYGVKVLNENWKTFLSNASLQAEYHGTFDAVTFMDTVEHYVSNVHVSRMTTKSTLPSLSKEEDCDTAHNTYYNMFEMASKMIDKASPRKRVFISMLHTGASYSKMTFDKAVWMLLLTRFHSGHYPAAYRCHCILSACEPDVDEKLGQYHGLAKYSTRHFKLVRIDDVTEDYRMTAVKSTGHFQSPEYVWTAKKFGRMFLKALYDPYFLYPILEWRWDAWMRMYGPNYTSPTYDPEYRRTVSDQICYWMTFVLKD